MLPGMSVSPLGRSVKVKNNKVLLFERDDVERGKTAADPEEMTSRV